MAAKRLMLAPLLDGAGTLGADPVMVAVQTFLRVVPMDACVAACKGWHRRLAIVLRFTGLRVQQAMGLRWDDVDLERAKVTVHGEVRQSAQERRGRELSISEHLVAELAQTDRRRRPPYGPRRHVDAIWWRAPRSH